MPLVWIVLLSAVLWATEVQATDYYNISFEARTCNTIITDVSVDGILWDTFPSATYADPFVRCTLTPPSGAGSKYVEWHIPCSAYNASGRCTAGGATDGGVDMGSSSLNIAITSGLTFYQGAFVRFDRVASRDVWLDTGSADSFDKLFEFGDEGTGTRWGVSSGWPSGNHTATNGKFTFDIWCAQSVIPSCSPDHKVQNVSPYGSSTPFLADYGRWYALVLEVTMQTGSTGRARLWINGTKVIEVNNIITRTASGVITRLYTNSTFGQPAYDTPEHYRYWDRMVFTDNLTTITNAGLMSDPESGSDTTPPSAPTSVFISKR